MCRHAAYVGPTIAAAGLLTDLDHGLEHQSYAPERLLTGSVCADGYGIGWYDRAGDDRGARYAFAGPIWSDQNLRTLAPAIRSDLIVAAVRNGTVAGSNTEANCAPFLDGHHMASLNGFLEDFDDWIGPLSDLLPPERRRAVRGDTDGEWLFQLILHLSGLHDGPGALAAGVQEACRMVLEWGRSLGKACQLNLVVADGVHVVATRAGSTPSQNSLFLLSDGEEFPGAHVVASEPLYDDALWSEVPTDTLLVLSQDAPPVRLTI